MEETLDQFIPNDEIEAKDLVPGKRYEVWASNYCLFVDAKGIFLSFEKELGNDGEPSEVDDHETVNFDFGQVWGYHLRFREIKGSENVILPSIEG